MKVQFHEVAVVSELYEAGRQDDGVPFIAERYFLQVTKPNGERWDHRLTLAGANVERDEEGYPHFEDIRAQQLRRAARMRRRVRRAGVIDLALWSEGRPVYGSPAYCGDEEVALERKEAEEEMFR